MWGHRGGPRTSQGGPMGNQKIQLEINTCLENIKHDLKNLCNSQCPNGPPNGIKCGTKQEPAWEYFVFYMD